MARTGEEGTITCLGGEGVRFVGEVQGEGPVVCAGDVEGSIAVDGPVRIAPGAHVRGDLRVREADIAGSVDGDVTTRGRLTLRATARVQGDVVTPELVVEAGAILQGQVRTTREAPDLARGTPPTAAALFP